MALEPQILALALNAAPLALGSLQSLFGQLKNPTANSAMVQALPEPSVTLTPDDVRPFGYEDWSDDDIYYSVATGEPSKLHGYGVNLPSGTAMELPDAFRALPHNLDIDYSKADIPANAGFPNVDPNMFGTLNPKRLKNTSMKGLF